jgi:hypothetical protein
MVKSQQKHAANQFKEMSMPHVDTHAKLINNWIIDNHADEGAGVRLEGMASYLANIILLHNTLVGNPTGGRVLPDLEADEVQLRGFLPLVMKNYEP